MKLRLLVVFITVSTASLGQGLSSQWLLGYWPFAYPKGRMIFNDTAYNYFTEFRKMPFEGTEANICDASGNFLMSSNGIWIANANNDTMMNGSGLNPGPETGAYPNGLLLPYANIFLPYPGDSTKYVLFHHTATFNGSYYPSNEILYSVIDKTLDSGLGAAISKNDTAFSDTLNWGIAACKHANGRDWWIVAIKDSSDIIYKILLTPNGITSITTQSLGYTPYQVDNVAQLTFSPDGSKFISSTYPVGNPYESYLILCDFDRCTGMFSNTHVINTTDGHIQFGLSFSPNSEFAYKASTVHIFQIDVNNFTVDTVAVIDTFSSSGFLMNFFLMYRAANGKIYITSSNSAQHLHEMNYPDSAGASCDVQKHAINLGIWLFRSVPNHPNYYLGPVTGSVCDSLGLSVQEVNYDFHFRIYPNPVTDQQLKIVYLLPKNKSGIFEMFDINGRKIYSMTLPQWSTLQLITLPKLSDGLYECVIASGKERVSRKVAMITE